MNGFKRTSLLKIIGITLMILTILGVITKEVYAVQPNTIPALQQWTDGTGSFSLITTSRIVLNQANSSDLATTGQVFQSDLLALTGVTHPVVTGTQSSLLTGDIFLTLGDTDPSIGTEGYNMTIGNTIVISAAADSGTFYGTRTILQLIKQSSTIQAGTAKDFPRYPFRALHVDNGRLFVTVDWLENHIKELAYLKMNIFHWHLAENNNFRFQSDTHPEVVAKQFYTKAQVAQMMALAAQYHVTIVPEFEMPGHMNWMLRAHPELRVVNSSGSASSDNIDLTNPASYTIINDLLNEWLPLIPGPYFHMGSDEYITDYTQYPQYLTYAQKNFGSNANAKDVYIHFLNLVDGIVHSFGKKTLAWDDGKTGGSVFTVNKDFIFDSWTFAAQSELKAGYSINNSSQSALYLVWYTDWQPMQTQLYEQWAPNQWTYGNPGPIPPFASGLLGAKLELWFDNNLCEQYSMAWLMHYAMRTIAQQTWASQKIEILYTDFKALSDSLGRAPGTTFPATLPPIVNPNGPYTANAGSPVTLSSAGTTTRTGGTIVNYNWDFGDGIGISGTQANPTHTYKAAGTYKVLLIATDSNGMTAGNQAQVTIGGTAPVAVTISPTSVTLPSGGTQPFIATVTGTSNTNVTWAATCGTINSGGLYTAPTTTGSCKVTATSVADTTKSASATVTMANGSVSVAISPTTVNLAPAGTQQFTATVTGSSNTTVTWATTCGTVSSSGFYTAPTTTGSCKVTTTSVADTTKSATATVTVASGPPQDPAQQLQADFKKTRLGGQATCTATQTKVTCQVPSSTQVVDNSQPDSVLDAKVATSVTTIQTDVVKVNPTAYSQLTCQLQNGSIKIIPHGTSQKYAVFTATCQSPLPFPT